MSYFTCPYCSSKVSYSSDTYREYSPSFYYANTSSDSESRLYLKFYNCPVCSKYSITLQGIGDAVSDIDLLVKPTSLANQYPDYIPEAIRKDYEEAYSIIRISPKASATLARRCLQGMIHDFWGIKLKNLNQEITELKNHIDSELWSAIDSLRQLGNIGAHMEADVNLIVDIDPDEANTLIKLIELLIEEWYINREKRKQLLLKVTSTNDEKQQERKKTE